VILTSQGDLDKENRNHLLYEFRLNYWSDPAAQTGEWLFQLGRHWTLWQDARIGTFPLIFGDPSGPASKADAEETGEDSTYWSIDEIIQECITSWGGEITETDTGWDWYASDHKRVSTYVQDTIVHAVRVIDRLYRLHDHD
jgi:hypothetical protein